MAKNTAALTGPGSVTGGNKSIVKTGMQNNDAMASPDTKSCANSPNLTAREQSRRASKSK